MLTALIWPKFILDPDYGYIAQGRSRGPLVHPPLSGQVLGIMGLVHFYFILRAKSVGVKFILFVSMLLTLLGIFYSYTRGPWLATVVGLLVLFALHGGYRRILSVFAVLGVVGVLVGAVHILSSEFLTERFTTQKTVSNRVGFLANAMRMIRDYPFFGIGYFKYMDTVGLYNTTTYVPFYGLVKKGLSANVPIHDIYLGRAAEEGIVGIGLVFSFYAVIFRSWIALWRQGAKQSWLGHDQLALFAGMMVTYLVGGMIIDYRYFDYINVVFYFLAGIIYGGYCRSDLEHRSKA